MVKISKNKLIKYKIYGKNKKNNISKIKTVY